MPQWRAKGSGSERMSWNVQRRELWPVCLDQNRLVTSICVVKEVGRSHINKDSLVTKISL